MLKKFFVAGLLVGGMNASAAFADTDLSQMISACIRHESDPQTKPFKTNVYCRGSYTFWEQQGTSDYQMPTTYNIYNRATMKGERYRLPERGYQVASDPNVGACNIYREMKVDVPSTQIEMSSCAELEGLQTEGRAAFCERVLDGAPGEDPVPTGVVVSSCDGDPGSGGNGGGGSGGSGNGGGGDLYLGAELEIANFRHNNSDFTGIKVVKIEDPRGLFGSIGLRKDDIVISVGTRGVSTITQMKDEIKAAQSRGGQFEIVAYQAETKIMVAYRGLNK